MADPDGPAPADAAPVFIKRATRRPQNLRKRERENDGEDQVDGSAQVIRRVDDIITEATSGEVSSVSKIEKLDILYSSTGTAQPSDLEQQTAVGSAEYDASEEADRARIAAKLAATNSKQAGESTEYRGLSAYRSFLPVHDTARANASSTKFRVAGPVRASAHIRMTSRFDYAPDLCKDYNETGFCGFGDSCKFVHDRGDYKSGWELEEEWEAERARAQAKLLGDNEKDRGADALPEKPQGPPDACPACGGVFKKPIVVTACGHYFCEGCALRHARESNLCFVCRSPVNGQFKVYKPLPPK